MLLFCNDSRLDHILLEFRKHTINKQNKIMAYFKGNKMAVKNFMLVIFQLTHNRHHKYL